MKPTLKRFAVTTVLILLAATAGCATHQAQAPPPPQAMPAPMPTLIAIRDVDDPVPGAYVAPVKKKSVKKSGARTAKPQKAARPADCPKCPECPEAKSSSAPGPETPGARAENGAKSGNPALDALAKELSLALDANKSAEQKAMNPAVKESQ